MQEFSNAVADMVDASRSALWIIYMLGDARYGRTDEGFQRWLDEGLEATNEPDPTQPTTTGDG